MQLTNTRYEDNLLSIVYHKYVDIYEKTRKFQYITKITEISIGSY